MAEHCSVWCSQQKPALEKRSDEGAKAAISNENHCPFNSKSSVAWQEQLSRVFERVERERGRGEGKWNRPGPVPHIIPRRTYRVYIGWSSMAPGLTAPSLTHRSSALRGTFLLSNSQTDWWVSVGKPSHMCLQAPDLGSVGEHKAAALIKFPWSLPNLWDQWGKAIGEPMPAACSLSLLLKPSVVVGLTIPFHLYILPMPLLTSLALAGGLFLLSVAPCTALWPLSSGAVEAAAGEK